MPFQAQLGEQQPNIVKSSNVHPRSLTAGTRSRDGFQVRNLPFLSGAFFRFHVKLWEGIMCPDYESIYHPFVANIKGKKNSRIEATRSNHTFPT